MDFRNASAAENTESEDAPLFRNVSWGEPNAVTPAPTATAGVGDRFPNSWLCYIVMFLLVLASSSLDAPTLRLLENAACVEYYQRYEPGKYLPQSSIPETDCKSGAIQARFAILITVTLVGANFVELVVQIPLGILADRKGGKHVLLLCILSAVLYWTCFAIIGFNRDIFPIWCYYVVPFFLLIGGGPRVSNAMLFTILNDSVSLEQRTSAFSVLEAVAYTTDFFAASVGSTLMLLGLPVPFVFSIACFVAASIPTLFLARNSASPATRNRRRSTLLEASFDDPGSQPLLLDNVEEEEEEEEVFNASTKHLSMVDRFTAIFIESWTSFPFNRTILLCLSIFTFIAAAKTCVKFLIVYISHKYNWNIAQAGYLISMKAGVLTLLFLVLIPAVNKWLTVSWGLLPKLRDLRIAQWSIILSCVGALTIGVAPHILILILGTIIFTLGYGSGILLRAFASGSIDNRHTGQLYTIISICETLGALVGMPVMASAYSWGASHGSIVSGAPFYLTAILYSIVGLFSVCLR